MAAYWKQREHALGGGDHTRWTWEEWTTTKRKNEIWIKQARNEIEHETDANGWLNVFVFQMNARDGGKWRASGVHMEAAAVVGRKIIPNHDYVSQENEEKAQDPFQRSPMTLCRVNSRWELNEKSQSVTNPIVVSNRQCRPWGYRRTREIDKIL